MIVKVEDHLTLMKYWIEKGSFSAKNIKGAMMEIEERQILIESNVFILKDFNIDEGS